MKKIKYDKKIKLKSKHCLHFELGEHIVIDGILWYIISCMYNQKKTYTLYLKGIKPLVK